MANSVQWTRLADSSGEECRISSPSTPWPSSVALASFVFEHRHRLRGDRPATGCKVLELGAGATGIPARVLAQCGFDVTATDRREVMEGWKTTGLCEQVNENRELEWGRFQRETVDLLKSGWHLILGADLVYDDGLEEEDEEDGETVQMEKQVNDLLATVEFILSNNKEARFLCMVQDRSSGTCHMLVRLLSSWGLTFQELNLLPEDLQVDPPITPLSVSTLRLFDITLSCDTPAHLHH